MHQWAIFWQHKQLNGKRKTRIWRKISEDRNKQGKADWETVKISTFMQFRGIQI